MLDSYITLGRSGLRVSPLCLGTMTFGDDLGWGTPPEQSQEIFAKFFEQGGNFIDTANIYTNGHSERIVGDCLKRKLARRDQAVIATKFFGSFYMGDPNGGGASRKAIAEQCHQSLRRLGTDYIDLYWLHNFDMFTPIEETMRALDDLVRDGKVRYIGFSDIPAWKTAQAQMIAAFRGWAPLIAVQVEYSLLQRTVEGEIIPMAAELGLGVTPWGPLKGGALSGKFTRANRETVTPDRPTVASNLSERAYDIVDLLQQIGRAHDASPAAVALAWLAARPGVSSIIIGARHMPQLEANLAALRLHLTPDETVMLDQISEPALNFPAEFNKSTALHLMHSGATVNGVPSRILRQIQPPSESNY